MEAIKMCGRYNNGHKGFVELLKKDWDELIKDELIKSDILEVVNNDE